MNSNPTKHRVSVQQVETLKCDRCRKKWEVAWVETMDEGSVEHALTCDCGRVLKVVHTAGDDPPLMILQHSHWKTIVACIPAFAAGALFPVLSDAVILTAYVLSWIGCIVTLSNESDYNASDYVASFIKGEYRRGAAIAGAVIWSILPVTGVAAVGALAGHALWWWWQ